MWGPACDPSASDWSHEKVEKVLKDEKYIVTHKSLLRSEAKPITLVKEERQPRVKKIVRSEKDLFS